MTIDIDRDLTGIGDVRCVYQQPIRDYYGATVPQYLPLERMDDYGTHGSGVSGMPCRFCTAATRDNFPRKKSSIKTVESLRLGAV